MAAYDLALRADDLDAVSAWFDDAPTTSRFGEAGAVRGAGAIDAMRRKGPSGLARDRIDGRSDVWMVGPAAAVATLEFVGADGAHGLRTQVWRATETGWRITHAHLSLVT